MSTKPSKADRAISKHNEDLYQSSFLASIERNQVPISRLLLVALYGCHLIKDAQPITSKFLSLQYKEEKTAPDGSPYYGIGIDDTYFVVNWVVTFTFLRSFLMQWVFSPFASYICNIHSRKARVRFAEQSWSVFYYSISFALGVYLYIGSPYYKNLDHLFIGWPHDHYTTLFKTYYLAQIAFWIQQIFVLNIEERRKDHYQMFSHHIITCLLMVGSYYYHFTRIGHLILMCMDSVDIFFSAAKMLKYSGFSTACDVMFLLFLVSWVVLRHGVYNVLFFHTWFYATGLMEGSQCIEGVVSTSRCFTANILNIFLGLLGGLQVITLVWMYLILKVAYKVIAGFGAEDVRSDEDDSDFEEGDKVQPESSKATPKSASNLTKDVVGDISGKDAPEYTTIEDEDEVSSSETEEKYDNESSTSSISDGIDEKPQKLK